MLKLVICKLKEAPDIGELKLSSGSAESRAVYKVQLQKIHAVTHDSKFMIFFM